MNELHADWGEEELEDLRARVSKLNIDQILQLFDSVGLKFPNISQKDIVEEIKSEGKNSDYIFMLISHAVDKKEFIRTISSFENSNGN